MSEESSHEYLVGVDYMGYITGEHCAGLCPTCVLYRQAINKKHTKIKSKLVLMKAILTGLRSEYLTLNRLEF